MTIPSVRSASSLANGTGAISVAYGTHALNDFILGIVETGQEAVATPGGFTIPETSPKLFSTALRGSLFQDFAGGAADGPMTAADPGDHFAASVIAIQNVDLTRPIHAIACAAYSGTTAIEFPSLKTEEDNCLILNVLVWAADNAGPLSSSEANSSLGSVAEVFDAGTTDGNGGGVAVYSGTKVTKGEVLPTTATFSTSTAYVAWTIALREKLAAPAFSSGSRSVEDFAGDPAADGGTVKIWDLVLGTLETTAVIASGAYTAPVRFNTALRYMSTYDNGTDPPGCSVPWTAS